MRKILNLLSLLLALPVFLCGLLAAQMPAWAETVTVDREVDYFMVSGGSIDEIAAELGSKGPRRFWALTEWNVSWNQSCEVTYRVRITLPRLVFANKLPAPERAVVENVFRIMGNHEENHARMGLFAAEEVKRNDCREAQAIVDYWMAKNTEYDRQTVNGLHEGVDLPVRRPIPKSPVIAPLRP